MNIAALSSSMAVMQSMRIPETMDGLGSDRDGDADDASASPAKSTGVATPAPSGMGQAVDIKA